MARHVVPSGTNGDGTAGNPWVGLSAIVWATVAAESDKTLYVRGTFTDERLLPTESGSAGAPIIIRGDYAGEPGTLAHASNHPVDLTSGADRTHITIQDITLINTHDGGGGGTYCLYWGGASAADDRYITVRRVTARLTAVDTGGAFQGNGRHNSVIDCDIQSSCDGVWSNGRYLTVRGCTIVANTLTAGIGGDGIQMGGGVSGCEITGNTITVMGGSTKGGILANVDSEADPFAYRIAANRITILSDTGTAGIQANVRNANITGNLVVLPSAGTGSLYGISAGQDGIRVHGNVVIGGKRAFNGGSSATNDTWVANTAIDSTLGFYFADNIPSRITHTLLCVDCTVGVHIHSAQTLTTSQFFGCTINVSNNGTTAITLPTGCLVADPGLDAEYQQSIASAGLGIGTWKAGIVGYDGLALPLRPDPGAGQQRKAPGRRFAVGGASL